MDNAMLVQTQGLYTSDQELFLQRFRDLSGCDIAEFLRRFQKLMEQNSDYRRECERLTRRCNTIEALLDRACCPGNRLYSQQTLDEHSGNNQIPLTTPVTGLGGDYVDAFPVPPGKKIRLQHLPRPGYQPQTIAVDFALAGAGDNYLDLIIQLYNYPGGQPGGKPYGPTYRGNQFLNKDGTQIHLPFPPYRGAPHVVGSAEVMQVEISHTGAVNNLNSAYITLYYDADKFYEQCRTSCDPKSC